MNKEDIEVNYQINKFLNEEKQRLNMENQNIDINILANDLGLTRQNLNYHILQGRAGEIEKAGDGKTHEMLLTQENVMKLIKFLMMNGRSNKRKLLDAKVKYQNGQ